MNQFQSIAATDMNNNPFQMIGKDWMLITAKKGDKVNTMTASWGGLGVMWGKNVAYVVIRNSRYTKEFVDRADTFSISFLGDEHRDALAYLGKVSGREEDKIAKTGLHVQFHGEEETPFMDESNTALICRKMYAGELSRDGFCLPQIEEQWYKDGDYHVLYIGEITDVLVK